MRKKHDIFGYIIVTTKTNMDRIFTLKSLWKFSLTANEKYKHFNEIYRQKIMDYNHDQILAASYREYLAGHSPSHSATSETIARKLRGIELREKFIQDDIRLYKHEMMRWRDISEKVARAYRYISRELEKFKGQDPFAECCRESHPKIRDYRDCIAVNVRITSYNDSYKHHVFIRTVDPFYGNLTNTEKLF